MSSLSALRPHSLDHPSLWGFNALLVACCIFVIDTVTRLDAAIAVLYVAVLLMVAKSSSARALLWAAGLCAGLTLAAFLIGRRHPAGALDGGWARCLVSLAAIAIAALLALRGKRASEALLSAQAQLAHATRVTTLGELAASIAHEVNQPLAAIANNGSAGLRWLDRPEPELNEACESLRRITEDAHRASEVVARIRALARKGAPMRQRLSLDALVSDTLALIAGELARYKVRPSIQLQASDARVDADPVQLRQVLINLLINACQAMAEIAPRDRELYLSSAVQGQWLTVTVRDCGSGIAPSALPLLFTPFFTTRDEGMGMGLSICRSIIEAQGGRIWASNREEGGACLTFCLPLANVGDSE